jgi:hypothetical protein
MDPSEHLCRLPLYKNFTRLNYNPKLPKMDSGSGQTHKRHVELSRLLAFTSLLLKRYQTNSKSGYSASINNVQVKIAYTI